VWIAAASAETDNQRQVIDQGALMRTLTIYSFLHNLLTREDGQDLVEYALIVAMIAFGSLSGMSVLATGLNDAFSGVATTLTSTV
jgi:pilus assembly protein Flp/PilA